jgi:hypothetical protein
MFLRLIIVLTLIQKVNVEIIIYVDRYIFYKITELIDRVMYAINGTDTLT